MDARETILAFIPFVVLIGTFGLAAFWVSRRAKTRELLHRERLAMIEKGLMPPPETWPVHSPAGGESSLKPRYRSVGVVITAIGIGLMLIIGVAAEEARLGVGIGGAVAVLGLALFVNSYLVPTGGRPAANHGSSFVEDRTGD